MTPWVFGYGSLIWRPDFPFAEKRWARLDGWERRFWQGSTDHRGVPGAPGRVVTLIEGDAVWGMAFRLDPGDADRILDRLEVREQGGYQRVDQEVWTDAGPVHAQAWIATEGNPNWLGAAPLDAMARQIATRSGPSGHNRDYLLELEAALSAADRLDAHVEELAAAFRRLT